MRKALKIFLLPVLILSSVAKAETLELNHFDSKKDFQVSSECVILGALMHAKYSGNTCTKLLLNPVFKGQEVYVTARLEVFEGCNGRMAISSQKICGFIPGKYIFYSPKEVNLNMENIAYPAGDPYGTITQENLDVYINVTKDIQLATQQDMERSAKKQDVKYFESGKGGLGQLMLETTAKHGITIENYDKIAARIESGLIMYMANKEVRTLSPKEMNNLNNTPLGAISESLSEAEKRLIEKHRKELQELIFPDSSL